MELSNQNVFQSFISLIKLDRDIHNISLELDKVNADLLYIDQSICSILNILKKSELRVFQLKKDIQCKELELKTTENKLNQYQIKLDNITSSNEYVALQRELDVLKDEKDKLDDLLLNLFNTHDLQKLEHDKLIRSKEQDKQNLERDYGKLKDIINDLKRKQEIFIQDRPKFIEHIPEDWLNEYILMKDKVNNPVVEAINNNCQGCFYTISARDLQQLYRNVLLRCKECYRFLYIESRL